MTVISDSFDLTWVPVRCRWIGHADSVSRSTLGAIASRLEEWLEAIASRLEDMASKVGWRPSLLVT